MTLGELERELDQLRSLGLLRGVRLTATPPTPRFVIDGRDVVNLSSNNYLGLATHPELIKAAVEAVKIYGCSPTSSRLISGTTDLHARLEERLSTFQGREGALVFNSGYAANTGIISALMGKEDLILSDSLNHASIIDGCRLSRAEVEVYPHGDLEALEGLLKSSYGKRRRLVITEGLFSMDGDIPNLCGLAELAEKYRAWLMVDEAHAFGIMGRGGRGLVNQLNLSDRVQILMGTFGKALGSFGAFVTGERALIDYLINRCRPFIFSTALPAHMCAISLKALELLEEADPMRERLEENARYFREELKSMGFDTMKSEAYIVPVLIGDPRLTKEMAELLFKEGVYAPAIRPPSVPPGSSRIRCGIMATHSLADLDMSLEAFRKAGRILGIA